MNKTCSVLIPIYKIVPDNLEISSIKRTFSSLQEFSIFFIAPFGLNVKFYKEHFPKAAFKFFFAKYFKGIDGYNRLLISYNFYWSFSKFEYILICQPDVWIFRNEVSAWCNKGYDFIGAPLVYVDSNNKLCFLNGQNGGLSLRKVKSYLKVLSTFKYITSSSDTFRYHFEKSGKRHEKLMPIIRFLLDLTIRNNTFSLFNSSRHNEDGFWSIVIPNLFSWFSIAPESESAAFSFEQCPKEMFSLYNKELPMGCHGWHKYDPEFWKNIIKIDEETKT